MRIATLGIYHEANTFSPVRADRQLFAAGGIFRGQEIVDEYADSSTTIGGYLACAEKLGFELVPLTFAFVNPVGAITEEVFEELMEEMLGKLAEQGPWDGVLLNLHGAAVTEHILDADGEIAARVRRVVGPDVPVGAVLDMHANVSQKLVAALTITLVYQTNPHIDAAQRGVECAELVVRAARREIAPKQAMMPIPLTANIARQDTSEEPMAGLVALAAEIGRQPGMLSASVIEGFPYADVPQMGMSCLAIHDGDGVQAMSAALELASTVWMYRDELQVEGMDVDDALELAEKAAHGPVVLLDAGDNIGGGSPGDSTVILAAAVRRGTPSLVQTLLEPEAVQTCLAAGIGAEIGLTVGARHRHSPGRPVTVRARVRVISDGRFEEPKPTHGGFRFFDMGPTAVVETSQGHTLVLTSRQTMNSSLQQLLSLGIDPSRYRVVVAKGVNSPRAAYAPIASELIVVDTEGVTAMNLERFRYAHRRRPMYPFEPAEFSEEFARRVPTVRS